MTREQIQTELQKKGSDLNRLLAWLQQPKQGILLQVAMAVITEVCQEFVEGKKWYLESLMYEEGYRKALEKGRVPEVFWVETYILERCRWFQEEFLTQQGFEVDPLGLIDVLERIEALLVPLAERVEHKREMIRRTDYTAY